MLQYTWEEDSLTSLKEVEQVQQLAIKATP
jgi:hypothetical protein